MAETQRPVGVTLVSLLLILLALSVLYSIIGSGRALLSEWLANASAVDVLNAVFNLAYVVFAVLCAIGLWEMKPWAIRAYAGWAGIVVLGLTIKELALKLQGRIDSEWWSIAIGLVLVAVVLVLVGIALNRALKSTA